MLNAENGTQWVAPFQGVDLDMCVACVAAATQRTAAAALVPGLDEQQAGPHTGHINGQTNTMEGQYL